MAVTQIIGPRIKPMWADPVEWSSERAYDADIYVTYQGDSYATRQPTPAGIDITNKAYWVKISEFNAQAVAMQNSVNKTLEANETAMQSMLTEGEQKIAASVNHVDSVANSFQTNIEQIATNKNDIATNKNDIATNKNDIATNKNDIATNKDDIATNKDDIATIRTKINRHCVWIGDSYSSHQYAHGSLNQPCNLIPKQLGCTVHNYAIPGAGFLRSSTTNFAVQAQTAAEDTSYDHSLVDWVFLFGGNNDVYQFGNQTDWNYNTLISRFKTFAETIISSFPNARVVIAGCNSPEIWKTPASAELPTTGNSLNETAIAEIYHQEASKYGFAFINTSTANFCMKDHFDANDEHPNDAGYLELSAVILSSLFGNSAIPIRNIPKLKNYNSVTTPTSVNIAIDSGEWGDNNLKINSFTSQIVGNLYIGELRVYIDNYPQGGKFNVRFPANICSAPNIASTERLIYYNGVGRRPNYTGLVLPNVTPYEIEHRICGISVEMPTTIDSQYAHPLIHIITWKLPIY